MVQQVLKTRLFELLFVWVTCVGSYHTSERQSCVSWDGFSEIMDIDIMQLFFHRHGHNAAFGPNVRAPSSAFLTVDCTWCVLKNLYGVGGRVNAHTYNTHAHSQTHIYTHTQNRRKPAKQLKICENQLCPIRPSSKEETYKNSQKPVKTAENMIVLGKLPWPVTFVTLRTNIQKLSTFRLLL